MSNLNPSQGDPAQSTQPSEVVAGSAELVQAQLRVNGADQHVELVDVRPRVETAPTGVLDVVDRHLTSATSSDVTLGRYLKLFRAVRNAAALYLVFGCAIWAAGVYVATRSGAPLWAAGGLGLGGPAVAGGLGWAKLRRANQAKRSAASAEAGTSDERDP